MDVSRRDFITYAGLITMSLGFGVWGCGGKDESASATGEEEQSPRPFRDLLAGKIQGKCTLILDTQYRGKLDQDHLRKYVSNCRIREADDYTTIQGPPEWWQDFEDFCSIGYYSGEHTFSKYSPYEGKTFMKDVWPDVIYEVGELDIRFTDLSSLYQRWETARRREVDVNGVEWTLLSVNEAISWARENLTWRADEMVVVVPFLPDLAGSPYSYFFLEEEYTAERQWPAYFYNTPMLEWSTDMQAEDGLKPHNLPVWMHFAALNSLWNKDTGRWEQLPNYRFGGYQDTPVYFIDATAYVAERILSPRAPVRCYTPAEMELKENLNATEKIEYDWNRIWRHAFNVPSIPFWSSEKIDIRTVVIDLRGRDAQGRPEYEEEDVIDWKTFEDGIRATNPYSNITFQRYHLPLDDAQRAVLVDYFIRRRKAEYPQHIEFKLPTRDGDWKTYHADWHYHFDLTGYPGMARHLMEMLADYWGGADILGRPLQYDPYAEPYSRTGRPFIIPTLFFLTPFGEFEGHVGGWNLDIKQFAKGLLGDLYEPLFSTIPEAKTIGPALSCWSATYCLWWEIFTTDWAFSTVPFNFSLRMLLDPEPFGLKLKTDLFFDLLFGRFHSWAVGFPIWTRESLTDPLARELTRQWASYQFAESIQHNMGYKHETTVIFECPYLGMERGMDYRKDKNLAETWDAEAEDRCMAFYATEPGARDFMIDANTYVTHKMGAGTQHMLGRIWARREITALHEELVRIDPAFGNPDPQYQAACRAYVDATQLALTWEHLAAYHRARAGLEHLAGYLAARGEPVRIHKDWDAPVHFPSPGTSLPAAPALEARLRIAEGNYEGRS